MKKIVNDMMSHKGIMYHELWCYSFNLSVFMSLDFILTSCDFLAIRALPAPTP